MLYGAMPKMQREPLQAYRREKGVNADGNSKKNASVVKIVEVRVAWPPRDRDNGAKDALRANSQ